VVLINGITEALSHSRGNKKFLNLASLELSDKMRLAESREETIAAIQPASITLLGNFSSPAIRDEHRTDGAASIKPAHFGEQAS